MVAERLREIKWKIERKEAREKRVKEKCVYVQSLGISPWNHVTSDGMYQWQWPRVYITSTLNHRPPSTTAAATFVEALADRDVFYAMCSLSRRLKYVIENTRHIRNCCLRHATLARASIYSTGHWDVSLHCYLGWDKGNASRQIYFTIRKQAFSRLLLISVQ